MTALSDCGSSYSHTLGGAKPSRSNCAVCRRIACPAAKAMSAPAVSRPLEGRISIVTGSNSGIGASTREGHVYHALELTASQGFETALELARLGATVVLACRRIGAAETASAAIRCEVGADALVEVMELDLASLDSVRVFAATFERKYGACHLLVNNAGCNYWGNAKPQYTDAGVGLCAQVNFLGCYALTRLLEGCAAATHLRGPPCAAVALGGRSTAASTQPTTDSNSAGAACCCAARRRASSPCRRSCTAPARCAWVLLAS
jgi:hypothetical protein